MISLIQRVTQASVEVDGKVVGSIGAGLLALIGIERDDTRTQADRLLQRVLTYRIFADPDGRMNLSLQNVGGGLLLVSQFTLAADTASGTRPGFSTAKAPDEARELFDYFVARACAVHPVVQTGVFGAHMKVALVNDGPVTFRLQT